MQHHHAQTPSTSLPPHRHHLVSTENPPKHVLQHQVNAPHRQPDEGRPDVPRVEAGTERRHRRRRGQVPYSEEGPHDGVEDGGLHDGVRVDCAGLGDNDAVLVDCEEGGVGGHWVVVNGDGGDVDEVFVQALSLGGQPGGAHRIDDELGVGEGLGDVSVRDEDVQSVDEEDDAG